MKKKKDKKYDGLGVIDYEKQQAAKEQQGPKRITPPAKCPNPKCGTDTPGWQTIGNDVRCQQCGHQIRVIDTPTQKIPSRKGL